MSPIKLLRVHFSVTHFKRISHHFSLLDYQCWNRSLWAYNAYISCRQESCSTVMDWNNLVTEAQRIFTMWRLPTQKIVQARQVYAVQVDFSESNTKYQPTPVLCMEQWWMSGGRTASASKDWSYIIRFSLLPTSPSPGSSVLVVMSGYVCMMCFVAERCQGDRKLLL